MKMRYVLFMGLTTLMLTLAGCKDGAKLNLTNGESAGGNCDISLSDGNGPDSAHVRILIPMYSDKNLNAMILEQISESLGGSYEGSYADPDAMAQHYLATYMKEMREERADFDAEAGFERSLSVERGYETEQLLTVNVQLYQYSGGAHGGTLCYGLTFRKSDGRLMGTNTLNELVGDEEWYALQKEGLMEYFSVSTDSALQECLLDVNEYMIPAPKYAPCFTEQGMEFVYQQYEIAAYAAGLPSYTIPYERLGKYLNVTGRRLLGNMD